ncbi:MAG: cysteine-rich small domain-containing protein [Candidatus Ventricola sp.]
MNTPKPSSRFFQNRDCAYFPCHGGVDPARFSCLFCYCPLYALGRACGGSCAYTAKGVKDCSGCTLPHQPENYDRVLARFGELADVVRRSDEMTQTGDAGR